VVVWLSGEEEKGIRVTVTFPKKDAEWLQNQVESGEFVSLAEVVRMCVRTMRTGGPGVVIRDHAGAGITIPKDVMDKVLENPDLVKQLVEAMKPKIAISAGKPKQESKQAE